MKESAAGRSLFGVAGERRSVSGAIAIQAALERGDPLRLILVDGERGESSCRDLIEPARAAGIPVQTVGARHFERLCPVGSTASVVALLGAAPEGDLIEVLERPGAAWLLTGLLYPGNAGFAIRTAEVSGAAAVFLDTSFDHQKRREAVRAAMRADRFLPVRWETTDTVLSAARQAGRRIIGIEDVGTKPLWGIDLTGAVLFVVGGESDGIPEATLERCDSVARIPMGGFIRSYNLQAAVAMAAGERMRQMEAADASDEEAR